MERGGRHLSIAAAARIAQALGLRLADLVAEAERELDAEGVSEATEPDVPPIVVIKRPPKRTVNPAHFENTDVLSGLTGLGPEWVASAIESCYSTLDIIDEKLIEDAAVPLARLVEGANLSSMMGNLLGAGLAVASGGIYVRNRPHAYPDLLPLHEHTLPAEVKLAFETNRPKGHLPKAGLHLTFRYVLGDRGGRFVTGKDNRGDTAWIWEAAIGVLDASDYDISNTEGDSGKTAVIKTESFKHMTRIYYQRDFYPYTRRDRGTGPYGDARVHLV